MNEQIINLLDIINANQIAIRSLAKSNVITETIVRTLAKEVEELKAIINENKITIEFTHEYNDPYY